MTTKEHTRTEFIMGMPIVIDVHDLGVDPVAVDRAFGWLRWVDDTFSTYKDSSEITRINRGELRVEDAHPDMREVLSRCETFRRETNGYFDVSAAVMPPGMPAGIDPSGLVKGWSIDRAASILEAAGARNYGIYAGGDVRVLGHPSGTDAWRVGIRHPLIADRVAKVVATNDSAIATSGEYARGQHVIDPHTGEPPTGVLSVTVVGPDLASADAYATAVFAMGLAGPDWIARREGYERMVILADESVQLTRGFPA